MELVLVGSVLLGGALGLLGYSGDEYFLYGYRFVEKDLRDKLRRLRVGTANLHRWLIVWLIAVAATLFGLWIAGYPLFGLFFSCLIVGVPWYVIRRMAELRKQKIEDQMADAMVSLASAIKAGLSLGQSLEILAEQCPHPICQEFQQLVGEYQMGKPLERCLVEARERLRSENFALFAAAMEASRESGGRLNETVERIAHSVMELQRLERKVRSETAQARTSAVYMAIAPIVVLLMYYFFIDPVNTERLFTTVPGQLMLCASMLMNLVAFLWARSILNADI